MLKNIFLVNRWRKKLSICGNCYFILTLLGVCHETVNFVLPLRSVSDLSNGYSEIQLTVCLGEITIVLMHFFWYMCHTYIQQKICQT